MTPPFLVRFIFTKAKADLEQGIWGVQKALKTFRHHFGASFVQQPVAPEVHLSSGGAGSSTFGMLEEVESDLSKNFGGAFPYRGRG